MKAFKNFIKQHDEAAFAICIVLVLATIAGSIYGFIAYKQNVAKNQAIARAKSMDGRTYTINEIGWNFVGDTKLILKAEDGQDAGWIAMHSTNPLNDKINPLFLAFSDPHGHLPLPKRIKAHFRETPWTDEQSGHAYENFTGSFIEFEEIQ